MDCPICESTEVDINRTKYDDGCFVHKMECDDCESTWDEHYKLTLDFYEITKDTKAHDDMEVRFCCGRDWRECPCKEESEV